MAVERRAYRESPGRSEVTVVQTGGRQGGDLLNFLPTTSQLRI